MNGISRKNIINFIGSITVVFLSLFFTTIVMAETKSFGTIHRGVWSTEAAQIYYSGGVYFKPHYATHTHQGFAKYTRGRKTLDYNSAGYVYKPSKKHSKSEKHEAKQRSIVGILLIGVHLKQLFTIHLRNII